MIFDCCVHVMYMRQHAYSFILIAAAMLKPQSNQKEFPTIKKWPTIFSIQFYLYARISWHDKEIIWHRFRVYITKHSVIITIRALCSNILCEMMLDRLWQRSLWPWSLWSRNGMWTETDVCLALNVLDRAIESFCSWPVEVIRLASKHERDHRNNWKSTKLSVNIHHNW